MTKTRLLTWGLILVFLPYMLLGCAAGQLHVDAEFRLAVPGFGELKVKVVYDSQGQKVFQVTNPTDTPICVQPKDKDGNKIGGPIEVPAGGTVTLPPGADSDKSETIKKPKPQPKQEEIQPKKVESQNGMGRQQEEAALSLIIAQPVLTWPAVLTSFDISGNSSISEYSIAARNGQGAFAALDLIQQGGSPSNAALVGQTDLSPLSASSASFAIALATNKIGSFQVFVNGSLVASSTTGLGGATIVYSADGYGHGAATIPFDYTAGANALDIVTTDSIGATATRSFSYN